MVRTIKVSHPEMREERHGNDTTYMRNSVAKYEETLRSSRCS